MIEEIYNDIRGCNGKYQISNFGNAKKFNKDKRYRPFRILKPQLSGRYLQIGICKNGLYQLYYVHRLVLETFIGPCPPGMECCHNDGNSLNNFIGNLRYDTRSNNQRDRQFHGTKANPVWIDNRGSRCASSKLNNNKIIEIRKLHLEGRSCTEIAKLYCVCASTINRIINKKIWKDV